MIYEPNPTRVVQNKDTIIAPPEVKPKPSIHDLLLSPTRREKDGVPESLTKFDVASIVDVKVAQQLFLKPEYRQFRSEINQRIDQLATPMMQQSAIEVTLPFLFGNKKAITEASNTEGGFVAKNIDQLLTQTSSRLEQAGLQGEFLIKYKQRATDFLMENVVKKFESLRMGGDPASIVETTTYELTQKYSDLLAREYNARYQSSSQSNASGSSESYTALQTLRSGLTQEIRGRFVSLGISDTTEGDKRSIDSLVQATSQKMVAMNSERKS